jgi:hypothetical protein
MEATCSSETSADFQRTKRPFIPEDRTPNHRCENFKYHYFILGRVKEDLGGGGSENIKGRGQLGDEMIILKRFIKKWGLNMWISYK